MLMWSVSFTQNVFLLASLLNSDPVQGAQQTRKRSLNIRPGRKYLQFAVSLSYLGILAAAPASVGTPLFFSLLFATRFLLFTPYLILRPSASSEQGQNRPSMRLRSDWVQSPIAVVLAVGAVLQVVQTSRTNGLLAVLSALNDNPAVGALGYDLIVGVLSLALFILLT